MKRIFCVGLLTLGMLVMPRAMQAQEPATPAPAPVPAPTAEPVPASPEAVTAIVQESVAKAQAEIEAAVAQAAPVATTAMQYVFGSSSRLAETKVNLDLDNVGVRDALQRVLDQAKQKYVIDEDVTNDPKVRIEAKNVRLSTALDMLTQAGGVSWRHEFRTVKDKDDKENKDEKKAEEEAQNRVQGQAPRALDFYVGAARQMQFESVVRIGKNIRSSGALVTPDGMNVIRTPEVYRGNVLFPYLTAETRSTFTCPHCKGQATVIRRNVQPKCTSCQRTFHPDWKFCPYDNTPRPATQATWKFCPICGKEVSSEEAEKNTRTSTFHPAHDHLHGAVGAPGRTYRGAVASRAKSSAAVAAERDKARYKNAVRARSTARPAPAR